MPHVTDDMTLNRIELNGRKDSCSRPQKNWDKGFIVVVVVYLRHTLLLMIETHLKP